MKAFFDSFFFSIAILTTLLALADWLIGSHGRKRIQQKVGDWWLFLEYSTWKGLAAKDAEKVGMWLTRVFGQKFLSWQFIWRSAALSFFIQNVSLLFSIQPLTDEEQGTISWLHSLVTDPMWIKSYCGFAVLAALLDWLTIGATIFFLRRMARSTSGFAITGFALLDLITAGLLFAAVGGLGFLFFGPDGESKGWIASFMWAISLAIVIVPAAITAIWPSVAHLLVCTIFLGSKALAPVLKRPVSLLLLRFHESEKGALTLLALGIGSLAKLLQEWVKGPN